jgi:hypothetical protein
VERSLTEEKNCNKIERNECQREGKFMVEGVEIKRRYGKRVGIKYGRLWNRPQSKGQKSTVQLLDEENV